LEGGFATSHFRKELVRKVQNLVAHSRHPPDFLVRDNQSNCGSNRLCVYRGVKEISVCTVCACVCKYGNTKMRVYMI